MLLKPWSCTPMCETCEAMHSMVLRRPHSRNLRSPVTSNWRRAEPNWKPCVHSVQPRDVYLPSIVKTGVPLERFQEFSMLAILAAESSKRRSMAGLSLAAVRELSILMLTKFLEDAEVE